ncbi:MAG: NUDIX domain-containing protein [Bacteroidia bacterium]
MKVNHTVYINDRPIWFCAINQKHESFPSSMEVLNADSIDYAEVAEQISKGISSGAVVLCEDPDREWKNFVYPYTLIEAAGGYVENEKGEVLFIFRKGKWDLPKGKAEYDESIEQTAVREVREECGLKMVVLKKELTKTFHTYFEKGKHILKKTHWFSMESLSTEQLIPQYEEDITAIRWLNSEEINSDVLTNTYASIRDVIHAAMKK